MRAYKIEQIVPANGTLELKQLPFAPGQRVEIIILEQTDTTKHEAENAKEKDDILIGSVLEYIDPTEPVAIEDWEAIQ
ncbi:MAG: hypothetical protein GXP42_19885 [Chloroflexi bacterium]|nr:hypothetical protein [Chloroflexota bacterium]